MMNWCTVLQSFEDNSLLIDLQVIFCCEQCVSCAYADDLSFLNDKLSGNLHFFDFIQIFSVFRCLGAPS